MTLKQEKGIATFIYESAHHSTSMSVFVSKPTYKPAEIDLCFATEHTCTTLKLTELQARELAQELLNAADAKETKPAGESA